MDYLIYLAPVAGVIALLFAFIKAAKISKAEAGTDKMKEIASAIAEGAKAFLFAEYKVLIVFAAVLFVVIGFFIDWATAICFIVGGVLSTIAGYVGMTVATKANVRTANAAKEGGMPKALGIAFSGGAVMGLCVVGLGILGLGVILLIIMHTVGFDNGDASIKAVSALTGFSLGASSIALFARVGGGIYTKAADVGADLVGKVEAGIPEDDPRNPAVIADNVGDNVGDVAGMGADLFESYVGALVSVITLAVAAVVAGDQGFTNNHIIFPLVIAAIGVLASVIAPIFVSGKMEPHKALNMGEYTATAIVVIASFAFSWLFFDGDLKAFLSIVSGLVVGTAIGKITEIYTSEKYGSVKEIAVNSQTGSATNIISGISVGMKSTAIPILFVVFGVLVSHALLGMYGIALAAVGMLSTTGMTIAVDAYGPIADNAGGIAEMSGLDKSVRNITDKLDAVGNTTAAIGKGFAIGSAALTALALFMSYAEATDLETIGIDILSAKVVVGILIGGMLPYLFSAFTMSSVGKAANKMIEEVRRQFREDKGILEGTSKPDYKSCVGISTQAALKEMILPGVLAVVSPLLVGYLLGSAALGGMLCGALVSGVMMAIFMSNSGGAWDNAKKYIEGGVYGGKGSSAHKAAVVGDTVGDPFKDTSGPAINILIKLMTIVSLVFASTFDAYGLLSRLMETLLK